MVLQQYFSNYISMKDEESLENGLAALTMMQA